MLWYFESEERRNAARKLVRTENPMLIFGSPMCTEFCLLLNLSKDKRDPVIIAQKLRRARDHLSFCMELYNYQIDHQRYFLHEHPLTATSWEMPETQRIAGMKGVDRATCHQCQYGAETEQSEPIRKATRWMSNSPAILEELQRRCTGKHG